MAYYDDLAKPLIELWSEVENELIEEIARRIKRTLRVTETTEFYIEQLKQANLLNDRAVKLMAKYAGISEKTIENLIRQAGYNIVAQDEIIYRQALKAGMLTIDPLPITMSPMLQTAIQSCIDNAKFGLSNLTNTRMSMAGHSMRSLSEVARREYYNYTNKAFLQVRTGNKSTADAVRDVCTELARKGIQITYWDSGHTDSLEVAVRRNIRTSMGQTAAEMTLARMQDYQYDLVEVSSHFGARVDDRGSPWSHYEFQGKIFSLSNKPYDYYKAKFAEFGVEMVPYDRWGGDFYTVTGYGEGYGLCGWNCRHRFYPYFPGMTPVYPIYDPEDNEKQYKDTQGQRYLERGIRAAKREKAALVGQGASEAEIKEANARIRQAQQKLKDYMAAHPKLDRDYAREQVYTANGAVTAATPK